MTLFKEIVEADLPELIACPTVRAAISFKWVGAAALEPATRRR